MRFRVLTDEMNYSLGMVTRAISARPVLQAYEGVLIEAIKDGLMLTCTDGEITVRARVNAIIEEDGIALLPAKLFAEMVRKLPSGEVDVRVDEKRRATIRSTGSNTSMACMPAEDFPDIIGVNGENKVVLPCNKLRAATSRVQFAVSTDESRKILTGILMEVLPQETLFVGLDGFRLALQRIQAENYVPSDAKDGRLQAVVPGRVLGEVSKMLPDTEDPASIIFNKSHILYSFANVCVYATLLTGTFIDYEKILPKMWGTEALISRTALSNAIDRCSLMAREGKNNLIYLKIDEDGRFELTANAERGDVHEEVEIDMHGKDISIAFNSRYLSDIIHNIEGEKIRLCFNSNVSPCLVLPSEGREFIFLVLPVRIFGR